ncbi:MAG: TlpA family protein disulfide reductase, partial [Dehalococcoidia bacterium]|nr:TlpA family protein disulfide reductase [Dehalococcoidia bacterium]
MTLSSDALTSKRLEVAGNVDDAIEACYQQGWTDGLPVIPPTEEKVLQFLDFVGRHPSDVIGVEPVRGRVITAEKVAINAVMAGCRPEYMPVIVAAMEGMVRPEFSLHGSSASTMGSAPLLV